jgi:ankyrin repeat protein
LVELVQDYHLSPNIKSDSGITPIEMAAMTGSIECLQLLLSLGAESMPLANQDLFTEVAMSGSRETLARSLAIGNRYLLASITSIVRNLHNDGERSGGSRAAVQDLLNGRYQISDSDIDQCGSPLELCISISNYHSVIALLGLGASPNSFNHMPPLHIAVSLREPVLVALLLAHGASPNLKAGNEGNEESALHQADTNSVTLCNSPPRNEVTSYTRYVSEDVAAINTDSESAIAERTKACIDILLFMGADIEGQDQNGNTPLMLRILQNDLDIAEYFLTKGANLHAKDFDGQEVSEKVDSPEVVEWCTKHTTTLGSSSD